jgi:hypothetical protein
MAHAADPEEEVAEAVSGSVEPVAMAAKVAAAAAAEAAAMPMEAAREVVLMVAAARVADAVQTEVGAVGNSGWT